MPAQRRWLDIDETANYLGRSSAAIRGLAKRGVLPHSRLGRRFMFDRLRIDRLLEASASKTSRDRDR
jgi:excisionase family DNA binding protein